MDNPGKQATLVTRQKTKTKMKIKKKTKTKTKNKQCKAKIIKNKTPHRN